MSANPAKQPPAKQPTNYQQPMADAQHEEEEEHESAHRFLFFNVMPSWMVSFVTHVGIIVFAALFFLPKYVETKVALEAGDSVEAQLDSVDVNFDVVELDTSVLETDSAEVDVAEPAEESEPETLAMEAMEEFGDLLAGEESNFDSESFSEMRSLTGNETSGRSSEGRQAQIRKYGGNAASEKAVELALEWLARHQRSDGGWSLDHTIGGGKFRDKNNPGDREARLGATALALLPFLGHGDTHKVGKYKKVVRGGLEFLMRNGKAQGRGISWHEPGGSMYSHGLVSIVFGEAYAMSGDRELAPFAQGSIWFIEDAQDPQGGGWRYTPREPGDTSAVGWQLMAIKSGKMSGLDFNLNTIKLAERFLDSVSIANGACYGYMDPPTRNQDGSLPAGRKGTTSVGLLCRMYMGWDRENPGLTDGVKYLERLGPSVGTKDFPNRVNMYYNYYATQVMKHWGGSEWDEWNRVMRDFLVDSQDTEGTKKGSWYWNSKSHSDVVGGRLYMTALATMTLEVYYRYLPLYGDAAAEDDFPLD